MIANQFDGKCVERAISTMRMALGYEQGLPDNYAPKGKRPHNVIELFDLSFSDRDRKVWTSNEFWDLADSDSTYMETYWEPAMEWNDYLFAFAYEHKDGGHMVVGWPSVYGDMKVSLVVAVKI